MNKIYLIYLSLLLCTSLTCSLQAGDIVKAVRNLNIAQVEKEIKEHGQLDPDYKHNLINIIDKKIVELKKQQTSISKYINPPTILGILGAGLTKKLFDITTSEQTINRYTNLNQREIDYLGNMLAQNATNIRNTFVENALQFNFGLMINNTQNNFMQMVTNLKNFIERRNRNTWIGGSIFGALTGILALTSMKQLYNGLSTKNLKNNYVKALAIKSLLQQAPTQ